MKNKILIFIFALATLWCAGQTELTNDELASLVNDSEQSDSIKNYFISSILGDASTGGVAYLIGLTTAASANQIITINYAHKIEHNPSILYNDGDLVRFMVLRMDARDIDKKAAGSGGLVARVKSYLNGGGIGFLVEDYLVDRGK